MPIIARKKAEFRWLLGATAAWLEPAAGHRLADLTTLRCNQEKNGFQVIAIGPSL
jgi:hypothetical protein